MFNLRKGNTLITPTIILFIALLCSLVMVVSNLYSVLKSREESQRWQQFSNDIIEASYHLHNVERYFGYGGFIHHFKNLVLRRDAKYVQLAEDKLALTLSHLKKLKTVPTLTKFQRDVAVIESVVASYSDRFYRIKSNEIPLTQVSLKLDEMVKVDDQQALQAMDRIVSEIESLRNKYKSELNTSHQMLSASGKYLLSAIVASLFSLVCLVLLYLKTRHFSIQFESLFEHSPNALFEINAKGVIVKLNYRALQMFQYQEMELLGKPVETLIPVGYAANHVKYRQQFIHDPKLYHRMATTRQVFARNKSGQEFPVEINLSQMNNEKGQKVVIADVIDVTDKHKFKIQSQYDHLTRLYNRRTFEEKLIQELMPPLQENSSLIILDIDHFKRVNDKFGHLVGDHVLMQFSDIIHRMARKNDVLCRWGGEEFVILAPSLLQEDLHSTCERFRESVEECDFDDVHRVTCSIGATMLKASDTVESAIARADSALYKAKGQGRNQTVIN